MIVAGRRRNHEAYKGLGPLTKRGVVLGTGPAAFDAQKAESPAIWWDLTARRWGMVYTGYSSASQGSVGLAWSDDLLTWTKAGQLLAPTGVSGDPDAGGITGPYMWLEGGTYHLIYIGLTAVGYEAGTKTLCLATAASLAGPWTRHGIIIGSAAGTWRAGPIWHSSIVKRGPIYYLFFNASTSPEVIGYATATSAMGPWTVDDTNSPIITVSPSGWDSGWVGDPSVYTVGGTWYMAYYGAGLSTAQDGVATTTEGFPLGWVKHAGNPVLTNGAAGSIDETYAHKPFIVNHARRHHHFYTAVGSAGRVIALATQGP